MKGVVSFTVACVKSASTDTGTIGIGMRIHCVPMVRGRFGVAAQPNMRLQISARGDEGVAGEFEGDGVAEGVVVWIDT